MSTVTAGKDKFGPGATAAPRLPRLLVVDDDESVRKLLRMRLSDTHEVVDTGDPEQAIALALEYKPEAIFMDLMMPGYSGFELCQSFRALSYTSRIPIFVITGEAGAKYREHCASLGAKGYFQKPIDFAALRAALADELKNKQPERRKRKRVRMSVPLKLRGTDADGNVFEQPAKTENLSAGGFLATCAAAMLKDTIVDVFVTTQGQELYAGRARVVRKDSPGAPWQRYGFELLEATRDWVLQDT